MSQFEDDISQDYPYLWSKDSALTLQDFLQKYKPSMVQDDGTKSWIYVTGLNPGPSKDSAKKEAAVEEASSLLKEVTEKVESIKNDSSIPQRSNKKTGAKSKKELREQIQAEATEKLKEISIRHNFVCGKWLIFSQPDNVDKIWSSLATSLVSGPLASSNVISAKVATSPQNENPHYNHVMCLYMPDVYNKDAVTEVMKILLKDHGLNLTGVKSELYTSIGLDSKHTSGIQSTVWKNTALMKEPEIKELREAFFASLAVERGSKSERLVDKTIDTAASSKPKPKLKKKIVNDDPFASDDDGNEDEDERKTEIKAKKSSVSTKRPKESDADDADEDGKPKLKKRRGNGK